MCSELSLESINDFFILWLFRMIIVLLILILHQLPHFVPISLNGDSVCAAFLDLRKAFDSLDHCLLLKRLFDLGVSGVELTWFTDYLTQRLQ